MDHPERADPVESTGHPDQSDARSTVASDGASDPAATSARVTGEGSGHVPPTTDDRELARRLRVRDASALAELYRAHRRRAFGLAYRVLGDGAAAEDAVHAAFLALWERADRIGEHGRLDALVMTVVHRRAVDLARRRARAGHLEVVAPAEASEQAPDLAETIPDEHAQEAFARVLDDQSTQTRLAAALARLPEEQRTVVELAYFEGLTHRAIAERLGLPGGTVKSRLRLGLGHLRDALPARDNPVRGEGRA